MTPPEQRTGAISAARTLGAAWALAAQALQAADLDYGHGCAGAEDEAAWLALHAAGLPASEAGDFATYAHQSLTAQQALQIETVTAQRIATRQPLAYLLGEAWLVGLRFVVDPRVIVPRSFIAELLDEGALDPWLTEPPHRVLDM
ncbi:MAG: 50S ribosomal protein L3 N(5)-glutamine methyltransferase, partial [Thiomonas arsenitoxydans]|nr:50S ribosomal protein L3 N(5)-glutamine methyltransferase [Thiomonas arsenitoxydans]